MIRRPVPTMRALARRAAAVLAAALTVGGGAVSAARPLGDASDARTTAPVHRTRTVVARTTAAGTAADAAIDPNVVAFTQAQTTWTPASPSVAAGGGYVVAAANAHFGTWTAAGEPAPGGGAVSLAEFFAPIVDTVPPEFALDIAQPQVLRDPATGRWVLAAVAWPKDPDLHWPVVLLSASDTPDPTASWCSHFVAVGRDIDGTDRAVLDRVELALTRRGLVVLSNLTALESDGARRFAAARLHVAPTAQLFGTSCEAVDVQWRDLIYEGANENFDRAALAAAQPVGDTVYALGSGAAGGLEVRIWEIPVQADGSFGLISDWNVAVPPYDVPPNAAQPGTPVEIYTGGAEIRSAAVRGDSLWAVQSLDDGGRAGIGWYRFDLADLDASEWGRFGIGEVDHALYPAIVPAAACDNAYVAYGVSGPSRAAGVGLTDIRGDQAYDVAVGEGCVGGRGDGAAAWGAQIGLALDPASGKVWGHAPFATGIAADCAANGWATALFGVEWDVCEGVAPPSDVRSIGFALASKRVMRGVYGPGGAIRRRAGAMDGPALTGIQVQNIDGQRTAQPALDFGEQRLPYEAPGRPLAVGTVAMQPIRPFGSLNAYVPSLDLPDAMFRVTISTPPDSGDLGAILRTDWDSGGAVVVSNLHFTARTVVPIAHRAYGGHTTVLALSNAEDAPVDVTLRFYRTGSSAEAAAKTFTMQPAEALTFDLADDDPAFRRLGDGFRGTAVIDAAGGRVGAQVYDYVTSSALAIGGFEGIPAEQGSSRLFVPLFRSRQHGPGGIRLDTAIAVANAGAAPATVTVTYRPTSNASASEACRAAGPIVHGPVAIPPGTNAIFDQGPGGGHGLPDHCFGSAVVETADPDGAVVATVLDVQNGGETLSMINAAPAEFAARSVALPLFRSRHLRAAYTTGIQVMNTSDRPARVYIAFARTHDNESFPIPDCGSACEAVIAPFEAHTWWPPAVAAIPNGSYGAAVVSSLEPIVVLVNDYPLQGASDMATYAGIPLVAAP